MSVFVRLSGNAANGVANVMVMVPMPDAAGNQPNGNKLPNGNIGNAGNFPNGNNIINGNSGNGGNAPNGMIVNGAEGCYIPGK